ncbi:MAG: hypothetical protein IJO88_08555 [Oscillospiraceae bacterium]|nr:hypothetical protein [Oscillospiraceae bacterium]
MKKAIALILALLLCLSLVACSGNEQEERPATVPAIDVEVEETPVLYQIGDTVSTDIIELVLLDVAYTASYGICTPKDGNSFIVTTFSLKNIGKTDLGFFPAFNGSESICPDAIVGVDYDDGYIFYAGDVDGNDGQVYQDSVFVNPDGRYLSDLKPLSEAETFEVAICVPNQVVENTEAPLLIKFNLLNSADETMVAAYSLR